jgi:putative NIF3 family GTP cyclohydrolase 1 type 2
MKAKELYNQLDKDFIKQELSDDWFKYMPELEMFLCDNFKNMNMGLMCDFTETVNKIYTAVFPSEKVLHKVLSNNENAMIFVHHASNWDLKKSPVGFYNIDISLLEMLKRKNISIYCLHSPLDDYGEYSTSKTLADALEIEIIKPFFNYFGCVPGLIGKTKCRTVNELKNKFSEVVGHETKLYQYGDNEILNNTVAVCAGGGNQDFVVEELIKNNINALITGLTVNNNVSISVHELEKENLINVFGGTHYSTEKYACIAICKYFSKLGLPAEFIEDEPCFEDL